MNALTERIASSAKELLPPEPANASVEYEHDGWTVKIEATDRCGIVQVRSSIKSPHGPWRVASIWEADRQAAEDAADAMCARLQAEKEHEAENYDGLS